MWGKEKRTRDDFLGIESGGCESNSGHRNVRSSYCNLWCLVGYHPIASKRRSTVCQEN